MTQARMPTLTDHHDAKGQEASQTHCQTNAAPRYTFCGEVWLNRSFHSLKCMGVGIVLKSDSVGILARFCNV